MRASEEATMPAEYVRLLIQEGLDPRDQRRIVYPPPAPGALDR